MALELKELAKKINELFGVREPSELHAKIMAAMFSPSRDKIFKRYSDIVAGDLYTDYLQQIHQFWSADREEKKQDFTPRSIADLTAALTMKAGRYALYDFCAGSGALTIGQWRRSRELTVRCDELDDRLIPLLLFNLALRNIGGYVVHGDVLTGKIYTAYKLTPSDKYADIEPTESVKAFDDEKYDVVISNPPYNIQWKPQRDVRFINCAAAIQKTGGNANFAFVLHALHHLRADGKAALILPGSCLLSTSDGEQKIKAYLTEERKINAAIALPNNMFESTPIATCIMLLAHGSGDVEFIDARAETKNETRDQRGEGKAAANRIYHKTVNAFSSENIDRICTAVEQRSEESDFSSRADAETIKGKEYALAPSYYITYRQVKVKHRPYDDIVADLNRIRRARASVKLTMNEALARKLGWDVIAQDMARGDELEKSINDSLRLVGCALDPVPRQFVTSKDAGVFKIENMSKTELSPVLALFLSAFQQHIYMMNIEENRVLAELRDALLPDLMSGKIAV